MLPNSACPPVPEIADPIAPPEPIADAVSISILLQQSRAAHLRKKHAAGRANKDGIVTTPPNYPQAEQHIRDAITFRETAERLDPEHLDSAWIEDQAANKGKTSAELLSWFRHYLAIP